MRNHAFSGLTLVLFLWVQGAWADSAQQGIPTIGCPVNSGPILQFAAEELQSYLTKMRGVSVEIDKREFPGDFHGIVLDSSASSTPTTFPDQPVFPDSDSFFLHSKDSSLFILGGSDRAVLFGVYDYLERLGCRWLGPGEEVVPPVNSLVLPSLNVHETPTLHWRALELIAGITPSMVDWMAKSKLNVVWPETYAPTEDLGENTRSLAECAIPEIRKRGLTVFWGGHVLPFLFPESKYAAEHPEYFAEIEGLRLNPEIESSARGQLCTSNPEVLSILSENVIRFLENHPWIEVLFLWGNDTVRWCECEGCRNLEPLPDRQSPFGGLDRSVSYCRMVRQVSEAVSSALPGRRIAFNHYYNLEDVPKDREGKILTEVLPGPGVLSAVDDYHQCDRHPFSDPTCPRGKRIEPIAKMWSPLYEENIGWTYYFAWNFTLGLPAGMGPKMVADFKFLREQGMTGVVDNVSLHPASLQASNNRLNYYLYAKAAWDSDLNLDSVQQDYLEHYYGVASEPMRAFWKLSEDSWSRLGTDPAFLPEDPRLSAPEAIHGRAIDSIDRILAEGEPRQTDPRLLIPNQTVYQKMHSLLQQAQSLVTHDPILSYRIDLLNAFIEKWDSGRLIPYRVVGFLNGGGHLTNYLYRGESEIACTVSGGGNGEGDCFCLSPTGVGTLNEPGDSIEVDVQVNYGSEVIGETTYRSGPGLYQAEDEVTPCGQEGANSVMFFIGHQDSEEVGAHRVMVLVSEGKFQTEILSSADRVWDYGDSVRLRIQYTETTDRGHTYRYSYRLKEDWNVLGEHTFAKRLAFAAPMHRWGGLEKGAQARFPLLDWAKVRFVREN